MNHVLHTLLPNPLGISDSQSYLAGKIFGPRAGAAYDGPGYIGRVGVTGINKFYRSDDTFQTLNGGGSLLYANTTIPAGNTIANTAAETAFASSYTIAANSYHTGDVFTVRLKGIYSAGAVVPTLTIKIKLDSTVMVATPAVTVANVTNDYWEAVGTFIVNGSLAGGTMQVIGNAFIASAASAELGVGMINASSPVNVDGTVSHSVTATVTWSAASASNTITLNQMTVNQDTTQAAAGTVTSISTTSPMLSIANPTGTPVITTPLSSLNDFRIGLDSANWISSADQTAKGTLYLTGGTGGGFISVPTAGTNVFGVRSTSQLSVALANVVSGKLYDVFLFDNAGTLTIVFGPAWTNSTTRAATGNITSLQLNGSTFTDVITGTISVNSTQGARWLGTVYATGTNQLEDSAANRCVVNVCNAVERSISLIPNYVNTNTVTSYNLNSNGAFVKLNAGTGDTFQFVSILGRRWEASFTVNGFPGAGNQIRWGIGIDRTTGAAQEGVNSTVNGLLAAAVADNGAFTTDGLHTLYMLATGTIAGTITFYATLQRYDPSGGAADPKATYMTGSIYG